MHSPIDDTVSIDHAANIFMAARHPKSFVTLDSADHLLMNRKDARYASSVIGAWVDRYITPIKDEALSLEKGKVLVKSRAGHKFTHDIYTKDHHTVADEPLSYKGNNLGFNPYEYLLAGLGACTSMTMKMYAERKKIDLKDVEVTLIHEKIHAEDCDTCESKSGKVDQIEKHIKLSGTFTEEQEAKLYEIAEKCPVNRTLLSEIKIISKHSKASD